MISTLAERRRNRLLTLFIAAGALVAVAAVTTAITMRSASSNTVSGAVVPGLSETIGGGTRIIISSAEASYRIERAERGEQTLWVMRDRGDFPVQSARLAQLTEGLQNLRFTRRMTNDANKHARLGVDDPRQGGRGILVQIEDGRGALLVNLILGVEPAGLYVRRPDNDQTWAAEGELPPLRDVASWLDLRPLDMSAEQLARVEIMPPEGRAYILARDSADAPWRIVAPALATLAQTSVNATAEAITALTPVDVQPAPAIQGAPRARVRALTFDGVAIDAELIESDGGLWLKLVARASAPEQEQAALAMNNRVAAWAYRLSDRDVATFAAPLSSIVPSASAPAGTLPQ
jgi:hypothetical protein